jgi:hypothetical protein
MTRFAPDYSKATHRPRVDSDASQEASHAWTERLLRDASSADVLRHKLAMLEIEAQHRLAWHASHFNRDQPRVPAGHPEGGQWTKGGGGTGVQFAAADKPGAGGGFAIALHLAMLLIEAFRSKKWSPRSVWTQSRHRRGHQYRRKGYLWLQFQVAYVHICRSRRSRKDA